MFEFVRYTFLVFLGLASMMTMFISLAVTGSILAQQGDVEAGLNPHVVFWILGVTATIICLWLSSSFILRVPLTILNWLSENRDQLAAYGVISLIFIVFVIS